MEALAFLGFGFFLVPLGLILLIIVAVAAGRNEPDPGAERPAALYYAAVMFITVFTVLFAVFTVASSLLDLTTDQNSFSSDFGFEERTEIVESFGEESGSSSVSRSPVRSSAQFDSEDNAEDDESWRNAVLALIVAAVAAGLYWFHDQRRRRSPEGSVAARVRTTYLYAVSFVSVLVALFAVVTALYAVFKLIAPGVAGIDDRGEAGVEFGQAAVLAVLSGLLFISHLRQVEPGDSTVGAAPAPPPPPPPPVDVEPPPAPRKRRTTPLKASGR